jgi:hypothetical protein
MASIGIAFWFVSQNAVYLFISLFVFAVGEMTSSPKILEYIGRIAPKDKVALYMGCYFIPMSGGNFLAGIISGNVYQKLSDKITLLQKEVDARGLDIPDISENFTQNDYIAEAAYLMQMTEQELTNFLWVTYNPSQIWVVISGIGILTVIALILYARLAFKNSKVI